MASKKQSEIPRKFLGGSGHNPPLAGPPTNYATLATTVTLQTKVEKEILEVAAHF